MQIDYKRINEEVAKELNISEDLVKSISDKAFSSWNKWTRKPDSLILKIRGLGKNYFRKKKIADRLEEMDHYGSSFPEEFRATLDFILKEYEKYSSEKQKFRNVNNVIE